MIAYGIDKEKQSKLRPFLEPGERLLWTGAPGPSATFSKSDVLQIPLNIAWLVFIAWFFGGYWNRGSDESEFPWFAAVPFFLIAFYNLFGRLVFKYWRNKRTVYAVTDHNVAVLTSLPFSTKFRILEITGLPEIKLDLKGDGRGSITFDNEPKKASWFDRVRSAFSRGSKDTQVAFVDIANVRRVHDLIARQREDITREKTDLVAR